MPPLSQIGLTLGFSYQAFMPNASSHVGAFVAEVARVREAVAELVTARQL